jgi:hypothetical protein
MLTAKRFIQRRGHSFSAPVDIMCDDERVYVVKPARPNRHDQLRGLFNDHFIAHLGMVISAPVGEPALIHIPQVMIDNQPELSDVSSSIPAHGSVLIQNCSDRLNFEHADQSYNRGRFQAICALYGLCYCGDFQVIYANTPPHIVYSVDHGHFLPGGPTWTVESLKSAGKGSLFADIIQHCGLTADEQKEAARLLCNVTDAVISNTLTIPPMEWGVSTDERVSLMDLLIRSRNDILGQHGLTVQNSSGDNITKREEATQ